MLLALIAQARAAALPSGDFAAGWRWRRSQVPSRGALITAVAIDEAAGRLAVGHEQGALLRSSGDPARPEEPRSGWRRWGSPGAVNDLYFDAAGVLWIAAQEGLWRLDTEARLEDRSPAPGETARQVHRVRGLAGLLVAVSEAGAFVSAAGVAWQRIMHGLPAGPVAAVALRRPLAAASGEPPGAVEIWLLCAGDLWRVVARASDAGIELAPARRESIPGRPAGEDPIDVVADLPGAELAVLYAQALARVLPARVEERRWEVWHPVLPPGASARRLARAAGRVWLSTDRGLLVADAPPGPWHRTASPAGWAPTGPVVGAGDVVYAVSELGLLEGRRERGDAGPDEPEGGGVHALVAALEALPRDPELRAVHERALAYVGLEPEHFHKLRRGLRRRGWLPLVSLRAGAAYDRDTSDDYDQSFSYGELHELSDRASARSRDYDASLTLVWDLGPGKYPPGTNLPD